MRDIVKRLRGAAEYDVGFGPLLREAAEAADEIERLRKEVVAADATIIEQAKEIERLKEESARLREDLKSYLKTVNLLGHIANKLSEERQSLEPLIGEPPATEGNE